MNIRIARPEDAADLLAIYEPYVLHTAITFEIQVPTLEEFTRRIETTLTKYPYIVAEEDGQIVGYAYAGTFKARAAYDHSVEMSIYARMDHKRKGIGSMLYDHLHELLRMMGITNVYACVAFVEEPDEYLNNDSILFHGAEGYRMAGHYRRCGLKFGRWYDMVWMEKYLWDHDQAPKQVTWFPLLSAEEVQDSLSQDLSEKE